MSIKTALNKISEKKDLTSEEMTDAIACVMAGEATPAQIGALLMGLKLKGETAAEICAAAKHIHNLAIPISVSGEHIIDIVGTGGDNSNLFNVSTCAAFVAAGAGCTVAKHNNRSISSKSGSADLLETMGINPSASPEQAEKCINQAGIGFMFAPNHHLSFVHTIGPRRELGIKTLFNLLGPLVNPAHVKNQLIGVYAKEWVEPFAQTLKQMGSEHAMVVHSADGLDEISIGAPTFVAELNAGKITTKTICPEDFGFKTTSLTPLKVKDAAQSWQLIQRVLNDTPGPARDMVALNAGAGIYLSGLAKTMEEGVQLALQAIANGQALEKVKQLRQLAPAEDMN